MMREILFRGKRIDNGGWFVGCDIWSPWFFDQNFVTLSDHKELRQVYPDTISQYVDIQDKNNKKVFEGDIIRFHAGYLQGNWTGVIEYDNGSFMVKGTIPYRSRSDQDDAFVVPLSDIDKSTIEIIGNKWDNIDILKG